MAYTLNSSLSPDNSLLISAMITLKAKPNKENKDAVLEAVNSSNFLVPMETTEISESINILNTSDGKGNLFLPLFTDILRLEKYTSKHTSVLVFSSDEAWHWALTQDNYKGVVINPAQDALPLSIAQVKYLSSIIENGE